MTSPLQLAETRLLVPAGLDGAVLERDFATVLN